MRLLRAHGAARRSRQLVREAGGATPAAGAARGARQHGRPQGGRARAERCSPRPAQGTLWPATLRAMACNPSCYGLQPHVLEPATPMCVQPATLCTHHTVQLLCNPRCWRSTVPRSASTTARCAAFNSCGSRSRSAARRNSRWSSSCSCSLKAARAAGLDGHRGRGTRLMPSTSVFHHIREMPVPPPRSIQTGPTSYRNTYKGIGVYFSRDGGSSSVYDRRGAARALWRW